LFVLFIYYLFIVLQYNGVGTLEIANLKYEGEWLNGQREGRGKLSVTGREEINLTLVNDKPVPVYV
jgi:hypothetical protein